MKCAGWTLILFLVVGCNGKTPPIGQPRPADTELSTVDLHERIKSLYNFQPHLLNEKQIDEKSNLLDKFWDDAKKKPDTYTRALQKELTDFSNPPFFLFDGSRLLLTLSDTPLNWQIVGAAIARCDLDDVQPRDYLFLVHHLATANQDTTEAAFHILNAPNFQVFIPQHALTLGQDFCLIYMLFPTNQDFWLRPAIERLRTEKDITAQKSLLLLLWYAQTPESDKAITEFEQDAHSADAARNYIKELIEKTNKLTAPLKNDPSGVSEDELCKSRRKRLRNISDEALMEFDSLTYKIVMARHANKFAHDLP